MMTRTFHPIGQGAFYTERFEEINVVYDCGTLSPENIGINVVKQSFRPKEDIEILFISHFHDDHINMIKELKEHCGSIKNVILPLIDNKKILIAIYKALGLKEEAYLMEDISSYFGDETKIIFVKQSDKQEKNRDNELIGDNRAIKYNEPIDIKKIKNNERIASGTIIEVESIKILNWCFIPHNYEYDEREGKLKELLENEGIDPEELIKSNSDCIDSNLERIKEIYKKSLNEELNENSMLLYSGPLESKNYYSLESYCWNSSMLFYMEYYMDLNLNRVGCIYTGDGNLKKVNIKDVFDVYWNNVGTVQIPHHGSRYNFKKNFLDGKFYFCPISARKFSKHHPHQLVFNSIRYNNGLPIIITELPESRFIQNIYFKKE